MQCLILTLCGLCMGLSHPPLHDLKLTLYVVITYEGKTSQQTSFFILMGTKEKWKLRGFEYIV